MPKELKNNELAQWIHGGSDLITTILMNGFEFLKHVTTEKKDDRYLVDGTDVTRTYEQILNNIIEKFSIQGTQRLKNEGDEDYSALLGAYFRAEVFNTDDTPLIELTDEQLQTIYTFVQPCVAHGFSARELLDSVAGTPAQKHNQIISMILFNGMTKEQRNAMSKGKYQTAVSQMLESMFNIIEFMRTPFRVLILEEEAAKALTKKEDGVQVKTSGVDLQWSTMLKAFKQAMATMLELKKANESKKEAEKFKHELESTLLKCQGSFGVENERYKNNNKIQKILDLIGFEYVEEVTNYVITFQQSLLGAKPDSEILPIRDLITLHHEKWQDALIQSEAEVARLTTELHSLKEEQNYALQMNSKSAKVLVATPKQNNTFERLASIQEVASELESEVTSKGNVNQDTSLPTQDTSTLYQMKAPSLSMKKITLGALAGKLHLNDANLQVLLEKININDDEQALAEIENNLHKLEKINQLVLTINQGILKRAGFFSSAPYKKTAAIESAFEQLSLDEKIELMQLSEGDIKTTVKSDSKIGKFLKEIKHNRGFSICEATSFKFFKKEIKALANESVLDTSMAI